MAARKTPKSETITESWTLASACLPHGISGDTSTVFSKAYRDSHPTAGNPDVSRKPWEKFLRILHRKGLVKCVTTTSHYEKDPDYPNMGPHTVTRKTWFATERGREVWLNMKGKQ